MKHESLFEIAFEKIHSLGVVGRSERYRHEGLGLASREDGRAMRSRQRAHFARDLANRIKSATVETLPTLEHLLTECLFL